MATKQVQSNNAIQGLETNPSLMSVKDGSLSIAENITLNREGMAEGRRGFAYHTTHSAAVKSLIEYKENLLVHAADGSLSINDASSTTLTAVPGTWAALGGGALEGVDARGNLYLNRDSGIYKLPGLTGTARLAGLPPALDLTATLTGTGLGFLSAGYQVGYRLIFRTTDANGVLVTSAPCPQVVVANTFSFTLSSLTSAAGTATATTASAHGLTTGDTVTISGATPAAYNGAYTITVTGGTTFTYAVSGAPTSPATGTIHAGKDCDVSVAFSVPQTIQAGDKWELYRTNQYVLGTTPNDNQYLVKTGTYASGATVTTTDTTLDAFATTPLYTNEDRGGTLTQTNWIIPATKEVEVYKNQLVLGCSKSEFRLDLQLLSASGGLVDNTSSITITNGTTTRTYTFSTSESFGTNKFKRYTAGTAGQNIEDTARSLVRCINQDAAGAWWAQYVSGATDDPGKLFVFARSVSDPVFSVTANLDTTGDNFDPTLPSSGATVKAEQDDTPNRLWFSKVQEPESFPLVNYIDIGRKDKDILRLVALKDALIVIKEDGVFYVSGETISSSSVLQTLDNTTICLAPRSVVRLNNEIYMLSNQGFVRLNSNGVNVISYPIEPTVKTIQLLTTTPTLTVATGFERDRSYICWVPTSNSATTATRAFVYNIFRRQWSVWTKPATAAVIASGKLFVGSGWESKVLMQRDTGTATDLSDEEISVTITAVSGTEMTLTYGFASAPLTAGFTVHQGDTSAVITSITSKSGTTHVVELDGNADVFSAGAATVRIPIDIHVRHHPSTCGSPGITKTFLDFGFVLEANTVSQITLEVMGNENGILTEIPVERTPDGDFGTSAFGSAFWGDSDTQRSIPIRENVPNQHITGEWLTIGLRHSVSQERFALVYSYITYQISTDVNSAG